jgi:hypothetical protein
MTTYKILKADGEDCAILRDGKDSIPFDPDNTDYQAYLKWVEAGNTPQAADAATEPADEQGA